MIDLRKLRIARAKKNMTQTEVAERVGITQTYYNRIERGKQDGAINTLIAICKALDLQPGEIILEDVPSSQIEEKIEPEIPDTSVPAGPSYWGAVVFQASKVAERGSIKEILSVETLLRAALDIILGAKETAQNENKQDFPKSPIMVTNTGHHNKNSNNITVGTAALTR